MLSSIDINNNSEDRITNNNHNDSYDNIYIDKFYVYNSINNSIDPNDSLAICEEVKVLSRCALNTTSSVYKISDPDIQQLLYWYDDYFIFNTQAIIFISIGAVLQSQVVADLSKEDDDGQFKMFCYDNYIIEDVTANILDLESGNNITITVIIAVVITIKIILLKVEIIICDKK